MPLCTQVSCYFCYSFIALLFAFDTKWKLVPKSHCTWYNDNKENSILFHLSSLTWEGTCEACVSNVMSSRANLQVASSHFWDFEWQVGRTHSCQLTLSAKTIVFHFIFCFPCSFSTNSCFSLSPHLGGIGWCSALEVRPVGAVIQWPCCSCDGSAAGQRSSGVSAHRWGNSRRWQPARKLWELCVFMGKFFLWFLKPHGTLFRDNIHTKANTTAN